MIKVQRHKLGDSFFKCGKKTRIAETANFDLTGNIFIGDHVIISDGVYIFTHKHFWRNSRIPIGKHKELKRCDLIIGKDAFIGVYAVILGIDYIGEGAVVGAGAIVTKNIGDFEIWAGNPAKKIGLRNA